MTTSRTEAPSTWADERAAPEFLSNPCFTEGGQPTLPGVHFTKFTVAEQFNCERSNDETVGAATADPYQWRWIR